MFKNVGGKIKSVSKVMFWIMTILSWILGLFTIFGGISASRYGYGSAGGSFLMGLVIIALGTLFSWLGVIVFYGFGVIIENTDKLVELAGGVSSSNVEAEKFSFKEVTNDIKEAAPINVAPAQPLEGKKCPNCGETNANEASFCRHCGSKLD